MPERLAPAACGTGIAGKAELVAAVRAMHNVLGGTIDPHASYLLLRGMKTLDLRVERQNKTALEVARRLEAHPLVTRVHYPGEGPRQLGHTAGPDSWLGQLGRTAGQGAALGARPACEMGALLGGLLAAGTAARCLPDRAHGAALRRPERCQRPTSCCAAPAGRAVQGLRATPTMPSPLPR